MRTVVAVLLYQTRRTGIGVQTSLAVVGVLLGERYALDGLYFFGQQTICVSVDNLMVATITVINQFSFVVIGKGNTSCAVVLTRRKPVGIIRIGGGIPLGVCLRSQFIKPVESIGIILWFIKNERS